MTSCKRPSHLSSAFTNRETWTIVSPLTTIILVWQKKKKPLSDVTVTIIRMTTSEGTLTLWHGTCVFVCACSHCRGNCSASLRRLLRLSAPSWLRMPGSISVSCLVSPWPVMAKVLADRDAWTLGLLKWITVPSSFIIFTWEKEGNRTVWIRAFILQDFALSGLLRPAQVY